jgi:hypothetical protein
MMCDSRSSVMPLSPEDQSDDVGEPTQKTQPKEGRPIDIPVPKRTLSGC